MSTAIPRLLRDLKQLDEEPIVGANARPLDDNLMKWYAIVMGAPGSLYEGIPIRFVLEFDQSYPISAPKAFFDTDVPYTGGAKYMVEGRQAVCLNIFGNFGHIHTEWKNMSEGWTAAYTISTILIAMQGLMISDMLSTNPLDIEKMKKSAFNFKCNITKHDGSDPKKWFPSVFTTFEEVDKYLKEKGVKKQQFDLFKDFYICYAKKVSIKDGATLGYGISIEKNGMMNSPCEYLSKEAFNDNVRRSSTNKLFDYWLPILVHTNEWNKIKPEFLNCIKTINTSAGLKLKFDADIVLKICCSVMNNLVVEIMNNKNNLSANDKFINGYFAFYRLMKQFALDDPTLITKANNLLENFIKNPESRIKGVTPNLGDFLIYLTISDKFSWKDIASQFIEECDARNVFWYLIGTRFSPPKCPQLTNKNAANRAKAVYAATEVSRNIVQFQVKFSQVAKDLTVANMDSNYGLAPSALRNDLKDVYNKITKMISWDEYFKWLEMPIPTEQVRNSQLVAAMDLSRKQGYHK